MQSFPQGSTDKPSSVVSAVRLLYFSLVIGILRSILEWGHLPADPRVPPGTLLFIALTTIVLTLGIFFWLIYKMDRGRNWARFTFLVLTIIGLPFSIQPMLRALSVTPLSGALGLVQTLMQIIALFLLFGRNARGWFRPPQILAPPPMPT